MSGSVLNPGVRVVSVKGSNALQGGHASVTVGAAAVALPAIPEDATGAIISIDGADVRALWEGTTPTSSVGHKYLDGDFFTLATRDDLLRFRAHRAGSTDATLRVTYA